MRFSTDVEELHQRRNRFARQVRVGCWFGQYNLWSMMPNRNSATAAPHMGAQRWAFRGKFVDHHNDIVSGGGIASRDCNPTAGQGSGGMGVRWCESSRADLLSVVFSFFTVGTSPRLLQLLQDPALGFFDGA